MKNSKRGGTQSQYQVSVCFWELKYQVLDKLIMSMEGIGIIVPGLSFNAKKVLVLLSCNTKAGNLLRNVRNMVIDR